MNTAKLKLLGEGKTKKIFDLGQGLALMNHKDDITAGDGARHEVMSGKAVAACLTTSNVFRLLNLADVPTHFFETESLEANEMVVNACRMIKLEVVGRRRATGSYLKRNPQVPEGTLFEPLEVEFFLKDDSRHDPIIEFDQATSQWVYWDASKPRYSQNPTVLEPEFELVNGQVLGQNDLDFMSSRLVDVFEVLERAWFLQGIQLVDIKIEFGITSDGYLVVADVIDNDSWRIWPAGDKRMQLDKQAFRELVTITPDELERIKKNYDRVAELTAEWLRPKPIMVYVLCGSSSDDEWAASIEKELVKLHLNYIREIFSADKTPLELDQFIRRSDREGVSVVYIAVAGRRNALGGKDFQTQNLVINCPPIGNGPFAIHDLMSSLRMPSGGIGLTVLAPESAALAAAKHFAAFDLTSWISLRKKQKETKKAVRG